MSLVQKEAPSNGRQDFPSLTFHHDAWGKLVMTDVDGRQHVGVMPVRAFPISDPRRGLSICNAEGKEVLWIDCLDSLPLAVLRILEEDLARREFVPVIRRIVKISSPSDPSEWEVHTDRGRTSFVVSSEDHVRRLDDQRALIVDANGIRYLIADTGTLDIGSRRLLERYL